ncbi:hypothetical protein BIU88_09345 [Chlorobaculum limnaeum]|uniref:Uncharacterized protein n=1 Tax=Chlorobaculum limnaeum TaxID=274537 RepID=A0A1D8D3K6_CHLLM|nr:hypothetical protein [Chlorobaculum limnaeum]AOS84315.1 hypothetical protein BIU88_09345 [Chlorobaculum limnaeum]
MASIERRVEELEDAAGRNDGPGEVHIQFTNRDDSGRLIDQEGKPLFYDPDAVYVGFSPDDIEQMKANSERKRKR